MWLLSSQSLTILCKAYGYIIASLEGNHINHTVAFHSKFNSTQQLSMQQPSFLCCPAASRSFSENSSHYLKKILEVCSDVQLSGCDQCHNATEPSLVKTYHTVDTQHWQHRLKLIIKLHTVRNSVQLNCQTWCSVCIFQLIYKQ